MVVDVRNRSNLKMFLGEKIISTWGGLNMRSKGEDSIKDGVPSSGLHNRMADHIIPQPRILKEPLRDG